MFLVVYFVSFIPCSCSQEPDTLVFVTPFLEEVEVCLISQCELMRSVDKVDSRRVHLIGVAEADTMEITSHEESC